MQESIAISKDKTNKQQGFKYRGIDDVMNTFYPLLSKHKVFIVPEVLEQTREERVSKQGGTLLYSILKIKYTFYAEDGSSVSAIVVGEGMDSADKASNKAMAIGMKYAMFQVFCIPTEEMPDPDGDTPPPTTKTVKQDKPNELPPEPPTEDYGQVKILTIKEAYDFEFELNGKVLKVGECNNEQLFWLRKNAKDKLLEATELVLADKAFNGDITDNA